MNNLDAQKWEKMISQFQQDENDSIIDMAVKKLPPENLCPGWQSNSPKIKKPQGSSYNRRNEILSFSIKRGKYCR